MSKAVNTKKLNTVVASFISIFTLVGSNTTTDFWPRRYVTPTGRSLSRLSEELESNLAAGTGLVSHLVNE